MFSREVGCDRQDTEAGGSPMSIDAVQGIGTTRSEREREREREDQSRQGNMRCEDNQMSQASADCRVLRD